MARLRVLEKNQLTPRLAKYAERASLAGPEQAITFQVLGHCPDDDFFRELRVQFTDAQIVELGMMIGQYIGFGRLVSVLDLERSACTL